ncbi:hypothetical protein LX16_1270 [Stackebrandtia albiflava]|uniref:Uncharacterized protein n=1 Tax=Stackebrandtia albiflava TaxID=406432 RepID=A0A562VCF4_9ACTN|nr:DUF6086 family protein [Stackebrandtia albiflava]TWJ15559.1 hypothetical protein LX16_1270 [Stackebrandtia albiflava]
MSYVFDVAGETVWSPASRVGALFVALSGVFAEYAGTPAGLHAEARDWYEIEPDVFARHVAALLDGPGRNHPVYGLLAEGYLVTCVALATRAGVAVTPTPAFPDILAAAEECQRRMPR